MTHPDLAWIPVNDDTPLSNIELHGLMERVDLLTDRLGAAEGNNELLVEELNDVVGRMNSATEAGWVEMTTGSDQTGLQLQVLKSISAKLRDITETNPLLKRGHQIRRDYVYARGVDIKILPKSSAKRVEDKMYDDFNYDLFFSEEGHDTLMKARYTDGNRFTLVHKRTGKTIHFPLDQVSNALTDEDDPSRVKYIQRTLGTSEQWFATDLYDKQAKKQIQVNGVTEDVNREYVVIHKAYNRPAGATWGMPDALPAYLWVLAYSNYLKDNAALVKALSRIAIRISTSSKSGAENARRHTASDIPAGSTAVTGSGYSIEAMGNPGSGVNFNNGRPLAAMVAASLGISIVALLSDPGTGGSYGVAETLDPPTTMLAATLQASEADYYLRLLTLYGADKRKTIVRFPDTNQDPAYRELQSLFIAVAQGILSREEVRARVSVLLDLPGLVASDLPEPDGFNSWSDPNSGRKIDPVARQGNTGAVPGGVNQGETNNDLAMDE